MGCGYISCSSGVPRVLSSTCPVGRGCGTLSLDVSSNLLAVVALALLSGFEVSNRIKHCLLLAAAHFLWRVVERNNLAVGLKIRPHQCHPCENQ